MLRFRMPQPTKKGGGECVVEGEEGGGKSVVEWLREFIPVQRRISPDSPTPLLVLFPGTVVNRKCEKA